MPHYSNWKPGNPPRKGFNKTIGKFPEYYEEGDPRKYKKSKAFVKH